MDIRVIGIGQNLRGDDSAGLKAVEHWISQCPATARLPGIQVELTELPGLELINLLMDVENAIIIDAVRSGAPPGTIHRLSENELHSFAPGSNSAHGWGVAETLQLARQLFPDRLAHRIIIIGIEAGDIALGENLSSPVFASLDHAVVAIEESAKILLS